MANYIESGEPIISNSYIKCYSDHLRIHLYYFPYGDKKVKYSDINSCKLIQIRDMGFTEIKMWGMALSPIWWHADRHRNGRESCIILDTNHWPKIGLTMDDGDIVNVYNLINEKINFNPSKNFENIKTK